MDGNTSLGMGASLLIAIGGLYIATSDSLLGERSYLPYRHNSRLVNRNQ